MIDKTKEIIAMINYLGKHDSCLRTDCMNYYYKVDNGNLFISPSPTIDFLEKTKSLLHKTLIEKCKQKAINNITNIELANNNLFWCMKD